MKLFLIACLAVAAMADPGYVIPNVYSGLYNTGMYPYVNTFNTFNPIVSPVSYIQPTFQAEKVEKVDGDKQVEKQDEKAIVYTNTPFVSSYIHPTFQTLPVQKIHVGPQYVSKNGEVENIVHKREAESDPWMYYNTAFPGFYNRYAHVRPVVATNQATFYNPWTMDVTGKYRNDAVLPNNYASKGTYRAQAPGSNTVHVAKREADPLTVITSPYMYSGLNPIVNPIVTSPYMINTPVVTSPYIYNPAVVTKSVAKPIAKNAALGMEGVMDGKTVADDAWQWTPNYASKGMYEARTPGTEHRAKRESDPWTIYRSGLYSGSYLPSYYNSPYYNTYSYPRTVYSGLRYY